MTILQFIHIHLRPLMAFVFMYNQPVEHLKINLLPGFPHKHTHRCTLLFIWDAVLLMPRHVVVKYLRRKPWDCRKSRLSLPEIFYYYFYNVFLPSQLEFPLLAMIRMGLFSWDVVVEIFLLLINRVSFWVRGWDCWIDHSNVCLC